MKDKTTAERIASIYKENTAQGKLRTELHNAWKRDPQGFQDLVNNLDKKLDYSGRKVLRDEIENINKNAKEKKIFTPEELRWQAFRKRLEDIRKEWIRPHDKYDSGLAQAAVRLIANIQKVISDTFDYIRSRFDESNSNKDDVSPFYNLVKEAYKDKGQMLVFALNNGALDKDTAKEVIIKDLAYIQSQPKEFQEELNKVYAENIANAISNPGITTETKNAVLEMILEYQKGDYNKQISDYVKKGFQWNDLGYSEAINRAKESGTSHSSTSRKQHESHERDHQRKADQPHKKKAAPEMTKNKTVTEAELIKEVVEIGSNFDVNAFKTADDVMYELSSEISGFSHSHPELSQSEIEGYSQILVSVVSTNRDSGKFWKHLDEKLKQYDTKGFRSSSVSSRAAVLISAAGTISLAQSMTGEKGKNPANDYAMKTIRKSISEIDGIDRQQNFISGIADKVRYSHAQYILAIDAKELGLRAEEHEGRGCHYRMERKADALANKYRMPPKNPNYSTLHEFTAFCDRMPESMGGAQKAYEMLNSRLEGTPLSMKKLENDRASYNELNSSFGLGKIVDIDISGKDTIEPDYDKDFDKRDYLEWEAVLADADEMVH